MLAFWNNLAGFDGLVILIIALLIFGKRLPEVMRSLGKGISEFKKGMNDIAAEQPQQQAQPYHQGQQPYAQNAAPQASQPLATDHSAPPAAPQQVIGTVDKNEPIKDLPPKTL
ncbi:MAG: twin-arginine translocase TatA/TatE family subunit [Planctomycetota bacterium]